MKSRLTGTVDSKYICLICFSTVQEDCQAAVTHVRSQTVAVRKTAAEYLKGDLLRGERQTNGDPKW